ncbi:venom metalloproteinase antarease TserMP_A isoform X2 [Rhipicephalus microplus]|uniref:venom metalloproteinase antarease TserMP_A isoform X2 n=1 Tax=Rhipicephalus microplus TaxID=6941 RepID=UPI003F6A780F
MGWLALVYLVVLHFPIVLNARKPISEPGVLVYPLLLETRSSDGQKMVHLSDGNFVHLRKASVLHDTLKVYSYEKNKRIVQTIQSKNIEENLFENKKTLASLLLEETEHGIVMEGLINHTYRIEPLLEAERSETGKIAHKLYVVKPHEAYFNETLPEFQPLAEHFKVEARADVPAVFSPDVFIISDYEHSKQFTTIKKFLNYILVFFNGVKLRYETVSLVRIVPRLVGVEKTDWGRDTYEVMYGKDMIAEYTLNNFQSYIETRLSEFTGADAVMLLTGRSMVSVSTGRIRSGVAGLAMTGGMCTRRRVAESLDVGRAFAGVVHFAHELAHVYIPQRCIDHTWKRQLPKPSSRLPGDTMSRNKFCRRESGFPESKECTERHGDDLCKITCCPGKDIYRRSVQRAEYWCLDGTNCSSGKECYNGYCRQKRRK